MTLEQKIRNAIPELQEATKGCVIKSDEKDENKMKK